MTRRMTFLVRPAPMVILLIFSLFIVLLPNLVSAQCSIGGIDYQNGEVVTTSRCGSGFRCYCNQGSIECPFCSFPTRGGDLACANDGESVTFTNLDGDIKTCSCEIPIPFNNNPQSTCVDGVTPTSPPTRTNNNDPPTPAPSFDFLRPRPTPAPTIPAPQPTRSPTLRPVAPPTLRPVQDDVTGETCRFELEDGSFAEFQPGEALGNVRVTRCGPPDQFPCFCDPSSPGQLVCPYCAFLTSSNDLYCAHDDEVIQFVDNGDVLLTCSCEIPLDTSLPPIKSCVSDIPAFTPAPTESPGGGGGGDGGTDDDNCIVPAGDNASSSSFSTLKSGESFGTLVQDGPCGSVEDWPFICSPNAGGVSGGDKEYPYCQFLTASGDTLCARDGETVYFNDVQNQSKMCSCSYFSAIWGPQPTCRDWDASIPTDNPAQSPSNDDGRDQEDDQNEDNDAATPPNMGPSTKTSTSNNSSSDTICISKDALIYSSVGLGSLLLLMVIGTFFYIRRKDKIQEY